MKIVIQENSFSLKFAENWVAVRSTFDELASNGWNRIYWFLSKNVINCFLYYFAKIMFVNVTTNLFRNCFVAHFFLWFYNYIFLLALLIFLII